MKSIAILTAALLSQAFCQAQIIYKPIMTNGTVEAMVRNGASLEAIIQAVRTAPDVEFLVDNHEAFLLVRAGASDRAGDQILEAMQQRVANGPVSSASPMPTSRTSVAPAPPAASRQPGKAPETPMAEPPPPPVPTLEAASTITLEQGQTLGQVTDLLGKPSRIARLSDREVYFFNNLKVTIKDGKVSDVE